MMLLPLACNEHATANARTNSRPLKAATENTTNSKHTVVMIHGIARSTGTFRVLRRALRDTEWNAVAFGYKSTRGALEDHADALARFLDNLEGQETISFVTHSMGGLILRHLLARKRPLQQPRQIGRIVLIAPPNQGSRIADTLKDLRAYKAFYGPAGQQLIPSSVAKVPGLSGNEFAVVAGGKGNGKGFNPLLPGDDDGTVAVAETLLDGARDSLLVPAIQARISNNPITVRATISFLRHGYLQEPSTQNGGNNA